ncbi:hydantoinase B/oxoprolinase family protein [Cyanobium gracile]|uniref:N-methylhydantoinase B/acetone carboxylase, alpha subunit n=1 Tax=Cyanobium gracile (strain ATCC 27147 / PCC 6307) TaxID=292564 RepID=K9P6D4_CYAGP|nr:hydantoinase B/oxoprolinase family protein [Cyanobium gracile]AFY28281.1 N-methylhydantoinase B/acetone carboxylase, alpha subunit [Cyanobium gracile PCC 6307]
MLASIPVPGSPDASHIGWRFWIDRGGTFTDVVACSPAGELVVRKLLSDPPPPADGSPPPDPAVTAVRELLGLPPHHPIPPGAVAEVRLGTTVATNALLERQGAPVLLLVNRGFADLQRIGDQHRPHLFALAIERPEPPPLRVIEVGGRLAADGKELESLQLDGALEAELAQAWADGFRSVAVALLHACRHPRHEQALGSWLASRGLAPVVLSNQLSRQPRLVPRLDTTVLEAALAPVLGAYLDQVRAAIGAAIPLRVMTSAGALQAPGLLRAKDTILSGPAGGMVAAVAVAEAAGFGDAPILGFDMGGTSTDVFHFDGSRGAVAWERSTETEIDGLRLLAPMLPIHTVAAGGGSVLHVADGRLQVGPRSAGANPGPACYGRGGPLAVTDANLLLGRLPVQALPRLFGPRGDRPADRGVVLERFGALARQLGLDGPEAAAQGALTIAIERMAEAIRRISIQRGHDLRGAVLVTFGSAGGQLTCPLAEALGLTRVLLHPLAGVLSAYGIGLARPSLLRERTLRQPLEPALLPQLERAIEALLAEASAELRAGGDLAAGQEPRRQVRLELRYGGSDQGLELPWPAAPADGLLADLRAAFEERHRQRFGFVVPDEPLVVERLVVEVGAPTPGSSAGGVRAAELPAAADPPEPSEWVPLCLADEHSGGCGAGMVWRQVPLWRRQQLVAGQRIAGPTLVVEPTGTTVLEPGWGGRVLAGGELLLERQAPVAGAALASGGAEAVDPVRLELYNHRFSAIAEQMGERLRQCSRSVNIRERLDFSCALFDGAGRLVANAPHIPVHLGSMGASVASLLAAVAAGTVPPLAPGEAYASNDPFDGGTHLPDITVITPVFRAEAGPEPLLFVACRGHHADVGGLTPGSMPPFSRHIEEEGLLLRHVPLLRLGQFDAAAWRQRLAAGPHPVRNPDQLLADLQAQAAANQLGVDELQRLLAREGPGEVRAYMGHVLANAEAAVAEAIAGLSDGEHTVELDNGSRIVVAVRIDRAARRARIDFSGTSPQQQGNVNAPLAITKAAVLYVFRCLVGRPIPLNAGCFAPIDLVVPEGCLLHPLAPAAVVAGNVETSQAVTNALFGALGVMAAAQGTMNNLSFGDARCQYYETICGGTGAGMRPDGRGFAGASAVQSHMTNSRLTDPEILEDRFPVRLERFAIRRGSGGTGRWPGGEGVVRRLRFLAPMTVAILSGSRRVPPFGLAGGGDGAVGRNRLERADGRLEELAGCDQVSVQPGDLLEIATPGGGGYGAAGAAL